MNPCTYCLRTLGFNESYYVVKKAVKPKGAYKRWQDSGVCCEDCYENGKKVRIEE